MKVPYWPSRGFMLPEHFGQSLYGPDLAYSHSQGILSIRRRCRRYGCAEELVSLRGSLGGILLLADLQGASSDTSTLCIGVSSSK